MYMYMYMYTPLERYKNRKYFCMGGRERERERERAAKGALLVQLYAAVRTNTHIHPEICATRARLAADA